MPPPIKVDEDLPSEVCDLLRDAGYDARTVIEQGMAGVADEALWQTVQQERRCLLTADKGFANAVHFPPGSHEGVVLLRLARESRAGYVRLVQAMLASLNLESVRGAIVVIAPDVIRIHRGD
jgi:predicted nuclease of predicted toxin-antitoxin system